MNGPNYQKIVGYLRQRYTEKLGTNAIPESMDARLQKTVQHYMTEIYRAQSGKNIGVNTLNQEVVKETSSSIDNWLRKQQSMTPDLSSVGSARPDDYNRLFEDTNTRYDAILSARAPPAPVSAPIPDFRQSSDFMDSNEDPVLLMQRMQKQRDEQSKTLGQTNLKPPKLEIREEVSPSAMNPVPPQADAPPPLLAPRPQEYIIPQEDIVKYRDTEYNIFLTSSDRDWLRNTQRIEFVKAIVPIESLDILPRVTYNASYAFDTTRVINVFSLPFVGIRIAELNNNGFSTKPEEDNTFAIVQYDTTWSSDLTAPNSTTVSAAPPLTKSGYTGLIPKFLKTQKVYTPTPLATLQKLSIRMERHNGNLLTDDSDVWFFDRVCMGGYSGQSTTTTIANTIQSNELYTYHAPLQSNAYIFIRTTKYFPFSAIAEGDTILFQGYTPKTQSGTSSEFQSFINSTAGHLVIATGYTDSLNISSNTLYNGRNAQGYCNLIIIQNRFEDPTSGSVSRSYFGGSSGVEQTFAKDVLDNSTAEPNQTGAAIINLSRQTHIVLRIITRDMDSSSNIRPDNV